MVKETAYKNQVENKGERGECQDSGLQKLDWIRKLRGGQKGAKLLEGVGI